MSRIPFNAEHMEAHAVTGEVIAAMRRFHIQQARRVQQIRQLGDADANEIEVKVDIYPILPVTAPILQLTVQLRWSDDDPSDNWKK